VNVHSIFFILISSSDMDRDRRRLLSLLGSAGIAALGGCLSGDNQETDPAMSPRETESPTQTDTVPSPTETPAVPRPTYPAEIPVLSEPLATLPGGPTAVSRDLSTVLTWGPDWPHVFEASEDGWTQQATLTPTDDIDDEWFYRLVAVSADATTAIVSATFRDESSSGRAYVFNKDGGEWSHQTTLTPGGVRPEFARDIALSDDGTLAMFAAPGSVYVFEESQEGWSEQARFSSEVGWASEGFGTSVELSGDGSTAIVGAHERSGNEGIVIAEVYEFARSENGWSQQEVLTQFESLDEPEFAVSGDGSTVVIKQSFGTSKPTPHVFEKRDGDWRKQVRLVGEGGIKGDGRWSSMALSNDGSTVLIGVSYGNDPLVDDPGAVFVFKRSQGEWSQQAKLTAGTGDGVDSFGSPKLSDDGSTAVIGAHHDEGPNGEGGGLAYVFSLPTE
jgi:hypothetical protein